MLELTYVAIDRYRDFRDSEFSAQVDEAVENLVDTNVMRNFHPGSGGVRLVVEPFTDFDGKPSQLGRFIAEAIAAEINERAPEHLIVDRTAMPELLREQQFYRKRDDKLRAEAQAEGAFDAEYILMGKAAVSGGRILIAASVVNVEIDGVVWRRTIQPSATDYLEDLAAFKPDQVSTSDSQHGSATSTVKDFVIANWTWLWTVILVPLGAWLIGRRISLERQNG